MDPERFVHFVADLWNEYFEWATRVIDVDGDRGIDIIATNGRVKHIVQAKQYGQSEIIDASEVERDISLRQCQESVDTVYIITTAEFTQTAWKMATDIDVVLVDIEALLTLIDEVGGEPLVAGYFSDISFDEVPESNVSTERDQPDGLSLDGFLRRLRSMFGR